MSELILKTIHVDSIQDSEKKVVLVDGKAKYNFWKKKTDGSETKAYSQFQAMHVSSGNDYPIAYKEEERSFTNEAGKDITFKDRSVMYFATQEAGKGQVPHDVPVQPENPVEVKNDAKNDPLQTDLQRRVAALELSRVNAIAAYKKLEDKLKNLEALVSTLTGENAVAVHTSIAPKATVQQAAEILGGKVEGEWEFPKKG